MAFTLKNCVNKSFLLGWFFWGLRFEGGAWLCVGGGLVGWAGNWDLFGSWACFGGGWGWLGGWAWFEEVDGSEFDGTGLVLVVFCESPKRGKLTRLSRAFVKSFCIYTVPLFT